MASVRVDLIGDASSLNRAYRSASASTSRFGHELSATSGHVARARTALFGMASVLIGGAGLTAGFKQAIDSARNFQSSMELLHTQAGASQKEVAKLSVEVRKLGPAVGTTPELLATGLYHVESAGYRGAAAMQVLATAAKGAAIGHADLEQVTTALVAAQKSGIDGTETLGKTMGALNAIVGVGNMRMDDLTGALATGLLPAARGVGLPLRDVGAALATMTDVGVPAEAAATRLRMTFSLMAAPTKAATAALDSIGISQLQLASIIRNQGLVPALELLKKKLEESGKTSEEQSLVIARAFGGGRTSSAIITLLQQLDSLKEKEKGIGEGASGFGEKWASEQKTAEFASKRFGAALDSLKIAVGVALLPEVTKLTTALADWMTKMADSGDAARYTREGVDLIKSSIAAAKPFVLLARDAFNQLSDAVGGSKHAIELLMAAFVAFKVAGVVTSLLSVGAAATTATGEVNLLRAGLLGLTKLGPILIPLAVAVTAFEAGKLLNKAGVTMPGTVVPNAQDQYTDNGIIYGRDPNNSQVYKPIGVAGAAGFDFGAVNNPSFSAANTLTSSQLSAKQLTKMQLMQVWVQAGGSPAMANTMAAIAMAESAGRPTALNLTDNSGKQTSAGLWQISTGTHTLPSPNWADPLTNARLAMGKLSSQGLGAWGTYNTGLYKQYLGAPTTTSTTTPTTQTTTRGGAQQTAADIAAAAAHTAAANAASDRAAAAKAAAKAAESRTGTDLLSHGLQVALGRAGGIDSAPLKLLIQAREELEKLQKTASKKLEVPIAQELGDVAGKIKEITAKNAEELKKQAKTNVDAASERIANHNKAAIAEAKAIDAYGTKIVAARERAQQAMQFKALGLTGAGEEVIPGVKQLKAGLASVDQIIEEHTSLATPAVLKKVAQLKDAMKHGIEDGMSPEVRAAFAKMLDSLGADLNSKLDAQKEAVKQKLAAQRAAWKQHVDDLKQVAITARAGFAQAFGALAQVALDAFDRVTAKGLEGFASARDLATPAEQQLAALQDVHDEAAQQAKLAADQAAGDVAAVAEDMYEMQVRALQKQANAERQAQNDAYNQQVSAYEDQRAVQRLAFDNELKALAEHISAKHESVAAANAEILALMSSFGLDPTWFTSGANAGSALIQGLAAAFAAADATLQQANVTQDAYTAAATSSGGGAGGGGGYHYTPGPTIPQGSRAAQVAVRSLQHGGHILSEGLVYVHAGETVVPAGRGSSRTYNFSFPNYLGSKRELLDAIQTAIGREAKRNGGSAFAGLA